MHNDEGSVYTKIVKKAWPAGRQGFALPFILIVLASILVSGVIYFRFQNKSSNPKAPAASPPTSTDAYGTWKTYKNTAQGFSIRYPKEWFVKEYGDWAVDFQAADPKIQEASPAAVKVRYSISQDQVDLKEFEKIYKARVGEDIYEPLDVKSIINKNKNSEVGGYMTVDYSINRNFTALEGPRGEHRHIYEINKDGTVLKFLATAQTEDEFKIFDPIFQKMISSLKF